MSIRVTDTGVGIPEHLAEHVFEPFFTTKEMGAGTEALAQGFLVPASLFVVGGFVIWMGIQARRR